jgi:glycosyltransferase involved in cell wall biosynthesis
MARPRLSVVIPARGSARALAPTLRTCVAQAFPDCEFVVSDDSAAGDLRETAGDLADRRLRYVRTPRRLATSDGWEFAVGQATGEYLMLLGEGDGLLLHALVEIDEILRLSRAPFLHWISVGYTGPDAPAGRPAAPGELLVPLPPPAASHAVHRLEARPMLLAAARGRMPAAELPAISASAVHRRLLDRLRSRTGRVFRGPCPDVYGAFAVAHVAGSYHSCTAPMGLRRLARGSDGGALLSLAGRLPIADELRRLDVEAGHARDPRVPDLPLMAAAVADSFERARGTLFAADPSLALDRQGLVRACLEELPGTALSREEAERAIREAARDDPALLAWFETFWPTVSPWGARRPTLRRADGTCLRLVAADFGVTDVFGAADLCEKLLGYRDGGVNAHLTPSRPAGVADPASAVARWPTPVTARPPIGTGPGAAADEAPDDEPERALLRRICERVPDQAAIVVGAAGGAFVGSCLEGGCSGVYAVEASPPSVRHLRDRFLGDDRVRVLEVSLSPAADTPERRLPDAPSAGRSLDFLVEDGTLPAAVGVLTIGPGGHALQVVRGLGRLSAAVVMVEFGDPVSSTVGVGTGGLPPIAAALAERGYSHVLVVTRDEELRVLQLDYLAPRAGDRGHAIFVHDRVYPELAELLGQAVSEAQDALLEATRRARRLARQRLDDGGAGSRRWLDPRLGHLRHHLPRPLAIPDPYRAEPAVAGAPGISIVTATLNSHRFLERTIQSVLEQGYGPLEYVVQDGGSSDGTLRVLEHYREHLAAVAIEKDGGQADALNRGFARTGGEVMAYLNGDDLLLPGALRYVGRFFATYPEVDVVYGHRVLIDENDEEIGRWVLPRHTGDILSWADYVPQETLFWRRRIWDRAGGRLDATLHFAMDWDLLLRFRAVGARFVRLPRFLGAFRVHEDQKTSSRMGDLGAREMGRIRERQHGRPVAQHEVSRRVRGYLLRHMVYQKLYRLGVLRY